MFPLLESLPVEIQEKILSNLPYESLETASKVCSLWLELANSIAKNICKTIVPSECAQEVAEEIHNCEKLWLCLLSYHNLQQIILHTSVNYEEKICIEQNVTERICYSIHGSLIFVGNQSGVIDVYDVKTNQEPLLSFKCGNNPIHQIHVVYHLKKLIVITDNIEFYTMPDEKCEMKKLDVIVEDHCQVLLSHSLISVLGARVVIVTKSNQVWVFKMKEKEEAIVLRLLKSFTTTLSIQQIAQWNNQVLMLLQTGESMIWSLATDKVLKTQKYQEIRYQNPLWIFRGRIFCSTIISRQLLGLWHMESGTSYWLLGVPEFDLLRCHNFGKTHNETNEILCIALKQRLLLCGTEEGKILIYFLSDAFFDRKVKELNANENMRREFERSPDLIITTCQKAIHDLKVDFTKDKIYILTWSSLRNEESVKGRLQCTIVSQDTIRLNKPFSV